MTADNNRTTQVLNAADAWRRPRRMPNDRPIPKLLAWLTLAEGEQPC